MTLLPPAWRWPHTSCMSDARLTTWPSSAARRSWGTTAAIPGDVRRAVAKECERFVLDHIERGESFAVETTLRTAAAIEQAQLAERRGFATVMRFVATESIAENVARVLQRSQAGGHGCARAFPSSFLLRADAVLRLEACRECGSSFWPRWAASRVRSLVAGLRAAAATEPARAQRVSPCRSKCSPLR
jgi:hypothetical protein